MNTKLNKLRLLFFFSTIIVVVGIATIFGYYARGYRYDTEEGITPHGLLVVKSDPDGAQVFINGAAKTVTTDNLPLPPAKYNVEIKKEGFLTWQKNLVVRKEEVTEITAHLFKAAPSLTSITFSGASHTTPSRDMAKIAYVVPVDTINDPDGEKSGLWVIETINLPLGFSREPIRITDGDLENATWTWSPDGREIMLDKGKSTFIIETDKFTPQSSLINVNLIKEETLEEWQAEKEKKLDSQSRKLPNQVENVLENKARQYSFSPDGDMVLYIASGSATLDENLKKPYPGASTQKQERDIKEDHTYVYDIEEDRNFVVDDSSNDLLIEGGYNNTQAARRLHWFPTSRNLVLAKENKVTIMDYDGTNRQAIYSGNYNYPYAFPTVSEDRIMLLTNFGALDTLPNLYSVSLK